MWIPDPLRLLTAKLSRHIFLELTKYFATALVGFTTIFLFGGVIRTAIEQGLPPSDIGRLIPYVLPEMLRYTMPASLLLAASFVYGRMAGANEVVAIKAMGIPPLEILSPALVIGFLLSLATCYVNDLTNTWGRVGVERVVTQSLDDIIYSMLQRQRSYSSPYFRISVTRVEGRRLIHANISLQGRDGARDVTIVAEEAMLRSDPEQNVLRIQLRNWTGDFPNGKIICPGTEEYAVPLSDVGQDQGGATLPSCLPLCVIPEMIERQRAVIARFEQELACRAAHQVLCAELDHLASPGWKTHWGGQLAEMNAHLCRLLLEPHRRWAGGFSCFFFVWVGAPLAMRRRHGDFLGTFFLCFLPILVVYYPLLMYGIDGAKHGTIPPWSVWAGNLLLLAWGGYLLHKVNRY